MHWSRRGAIFLGLTCTLALIAQEPEPKTLIRPFTAYASAKKAQKKLQITIRVPTVIDRFKPVTHTVPVYSVVEKDGQKFTVMRNEKREGVSREDAPGPYKTLEFSGASVKAHGVDGAAIPPARLVEILATEKPVLLNFEDSIDPYHLQTMKPDTVILNLAKSKIFPDVSYAAVGNPTKDFKAQGAFAFPQEKAKVLCDNNDVRLSVWTDANVLYAQAVLWKADVVKGPTEKELNKMPHFDAGYLLLDLDNDGKITGNRDRFYVAELRQRLGYCDFFDKDSTSPITSLTQGRGGIYFLHGQENRAVRIDSFAIPLMELKVKPGDTIRLAYVGTSTALDPRDVSSIAGKKSYRWNDVPWSKFHTLQIESHSPAVRMVQVPNGF